MRVTKAYNTTKNASRRLPKFYVWCILKFLEAKSVFSGHLAPIDSITAHLTIFSSKSGIRRSSQAMSVIQNAEHVTVDKLLKLGNCRRDLHGTSWER